MAKSVAIDKQIGEKLREHRLQKGLTLVELSKASRVHRSHLGRVERSERSPSASVLQALADPLGCTEVELLKLGGYLSPDETDDRMARLKAAMKREVISTTKDLLRKIDRF